MISSFQMINFVVRSGVPICVVFDVNFLFVCVAFLPKLHGFS